MTTSGRPSEGSASDIRDRAHHFGGQMVDKVQEAASRIMGSDEQGTPVKDQVSEQVTSRLDMGKDYLAETVTGFAQALRQSGQHLREDNIQPGLATYTDLGAQQVERLSGYLRQRDTSQIVTDLEGFARRQPMVFAGGAFALGMLAVRFLRSSGQSQQPSTSGASAPSHGASGASSAGTPPTPGYPTGGTTAGSASTTARPYSGATPGVPNPTPASPPTSPSSGGTNPVTPAAPGAAARTPAPRIGGGTSSSARPETGGRTQP